jgi:hypothetical protein
MGIWYLTATTSGELERRLQDHQPGLLKGRLVQTTHLKCRNRIEMAPCHFTYSPEPALEIVIGGEVGACNPAAAGRPKVPRSKTGPRSAAARACPGPPQLVSAVGGATSSTSMPPARGLEEIT